MAKHLVFNPSHEFSNIIFRGKSLKRSRKVAKKLKQDIIHQFIDSRSNTSLFSIGLSTY